MKEWHFWDHDLCPRCHAEHETVEHVLRCPNPRARSIVGRIAVRAQEMDAVLSNSTLSSLEHAVIVWLRAWKMGGSHLLTAVDLREAFEDQEYIWCDHFMPGLPSTKWQLIQKEHYSREDETKWLTLDRSSHSEVAGCHLGSVGASQRDRTREKGKKVGEHSDTDLLDDDIRQEVRLGPVPSLPPHDAILFS